MASTGVNLFIFLYLSFLSKHTKGNLLEGKIVQGDYVKILNYPHAVYLEIQCEDQSTHICGSSILNQYYLISVAHCFNTVGKNGKIIAFAGHENIKKANVIRKNVIPIIHSKFDVSKVEHDIALLLLDKKMPLGSRTQRIIIMKNFPTRIEGSVAGWGDFTDEESILLKSVTQTLKTRNYCNVLRLGPGMFCAGSMQTSDPRPAASDSGSGLVTKNYQLIGLLSYKVTKFPALPVYTNVSYYYNWIIYTTGSAFCTQRG
ncbi:serine protease 52-like isoform X2 [Nymphalis io]|uniref:serine protease 52-like isoform X2 n=1 Tax=Inachis io TaxID=171585 RepID=UPI002167900B|nr:serine protease 52-like isoform X2 [Nymphalis io]